MKRAVFVRFATAVAAASAFALAPASASAQFWEKFTNRREKIPIRHPPQVVFKEGTRIGVIEFRGECGPELTERITDVIASSRKYELVDRANLESVLREQSFQQSESVSADTSAKLGRMLGAGGLVNGRITRCFVRAGEVLREGGPVHTREGMKQTFVRKTVATIMGSLWIVDVATGKTLVREPIEENHVVAVRAINDPYIAAADPEEVRSQAYRLIAQKFEKVILGGTEWVEIVIYDDKKWNLKQSADQIRRGDFGGAAETLRGGLQTFGQAQDADVKLLSKTWYNLGIALMYSGHLDEAAEALQKSAATRSTDIASEAMADCRKMIALREVRKRMEAAAIEPGAIQPKPAEVGKAPLTNADIISMAQAKLPDAVVLSKIKASNCSFDTSPDALIKLRTAGASDAVLIAITERSK